MITKEQVWKGLNLKLTKDEICKIFQSSDYEKDDYYNYELLLNTLYKAVNKEIDFDYFMDWCILIANCYNYTKENYRTKLGKLYYKVADLFDGISFMTGYDKKELMEYIARLKHFNYLIKKAKKEVSGNFKTNGIERIFLFDHCNWNYDSSVYKVIIKNHNTKEWEIKYFDDYNFIFDDNINYSFVEEKEFEKIFNSFYSKNSDWNEVHNIKF